MNFQAIKEKAKDIYGGALKHWIWMGTADAHLGLGPLRSGNGPAFDAILSFVLAKKSDREEMRVFAEVFEADPSDWIAQAAKHPGEKSIDAAWNHMVLRAREAGLQLIDSWDVRNVGKLIELFPESVPARYRGEQLTCYMEDSENGDWIVDVADADSSPQASRPSMRM